MKDRTFLLLAAAVVIAGSACASTGGGNRGSSMYQSEIGNACGPDLARLTNILLGRWHYEVYQSEQTPFIRIETYWRPRQPFRDETLLGVNTAESRIIITARPRGEMDVGATYNIRMFLENRLRLSNSVDWNEKTNTAMFRTYADSLTQMFKTELRNIGVRSC